MVQAGKVVFISSRSTCGGWKLAGSPFLASRPRFIIHNDDEDGRSDVNDDGDDDDKADSFKGSIKLVVERSQIRSDANLFVLQI